MKTRLAILIFSVSLLPVAALADDDTRFGRLFTEPKTRNQLDESRKQNSSQQSPVAQELEEEAAITTLKIDGVVMRRDGSTEVWVNGARSDSLQLTVRRSGGNRFQVAIPGGGVVTLKPGQVYSFESRRVIEGYEADKVLAAERSPAEPAPQTVEQAAPTTLRTTEPAATPEARATKPPPSDKTAAFDESELAEQDSRIKLMEERMDKLEQENDGKN